MSDTPNPKALATPPVEPGGPEEPSAEGTAGGAPRGRARLSPPARFGRRVGIALFSLGMGAFVVVCSVQIILQAWFPGRPPPRAQCRPALLELSHALDRARELAARTDGGERTVVDAFRRGLQPEWAHQGSAEVACATDPPAAKLLRTLVLLRYAEENSVRAQAEGVLPLRNRVARQLQELQARVVP